MKWLLVSTNPRPDVPRTNHPNGAGWNIGDVFARLGTEMATRAVDPEAEFDVLNVEDRDDVMREREFDRCVLAGRPLFWRNCETYPEWDHILHPGWPGRDPSKIAALGVGACYPLDERGELAAADHAHLAARIEALAEKTRVYSLRFDFERVSLLPSVCPSTWLLLDRDERPHRKLCNFMPGGGHYPGFAPREADVWNGMAAWVAAELLHRGFDFVAHSPAERDLARALGWRTDRIVFSASIETYLDAYASASHYVGNRMHGAAILAGRPARALAIGYDSRLAMVDRAGCTTRRPSQLNLRDLVAFAESEPGLFEGERMAMILLERSLAVEMLREFAG